MRQRIEIWKKTLMTFENNMENKEKIIFEIYGEEYAPFWDKKENCWVGHLGSIKFKIYEKNN